MLPCSTSPAVAPVAAATAAAAAVTEAGEVVCLLPTVKQVQYPIRREERVGIQEGRGGGRWGGGGKDGYKEWRLEKGVKEKNAQESRTQQEEGRHGWGRDRQGSLVWGRWVSS